MTWQRPSADPARMQAALEVDSDLRDFLREWRRQTAHEQGVAAFLVMHDTTLDGICRARPTSIRELLMITGIGERKAELYGHQILDALKRFQTGDRATAPNKKSSPSEETIRLIEEGKNLDEIAAIRGRRRSTIVSMVSDLVERGLVEFKHEWVEQARQAEIETAALNVGLGQFTPIKEALPPDFSYDEIRLVVANLRRRRGDTEPVAAAT